MASPRNRRIAFWALTGLVAVPNVLAALGYLAGADDMTANFTRLGYPLYFMTILGVWKLLGAAALLTRKVPRLTEWAYAGFGFVLSGAAISHIAAGDPLGAAVPPLVMLGLLIGSYRLQPRPSSNTTL